jgi:hypothetical protein
MMRSRRSTAVSVGTGSEISHVPPGISKLLCDTDSYLMALLIDHRLSAAVGAVAFKRSTSACD